MMHIVGLLVSGGWLWAYSIVWLNEELLLVLSFLLFCVLVNKVVEKDFLEFVASRNLHIQQHVFVIAKQYLLRDLRKQTESQQASGLVVTQAIKAFLLQAAGDVTRLDEEIQFYKVQAAEFVVRDMLTGEQGYVNGLISVAAASIRLHLEKELVSFSDIVFIHSVFKFNSSINASYMLSFYGLLSVFCSKLK